MLARSGWQNSHCFQWSEIWSLGIFYVNISLHIFSSFVRLIYSFISAKKVSSQRCHIWCKLNRYCIGAETLYFYWVGIVNYNEINLLIKLGCSLLPWICKPLHAACQLTCTMWYIPTLSMPTLLRYQFYNIFCSNSFKMGGTGMLPMCHEKSCKERACL